MISVLFPDAACFTYDLCGKFQSPSPEWMHLTRNLVNFELMVVTEGTLFIVGRTPLLRGSPRRISSFAADRPSAWLEKGKLLFLLAPFYPRYPLRTDRRSF